MNWFEIEEIDSNTFALYEPKHPEKVRSFLFIGTEKSALIDTGTGIGDIKKVVEKLTDAPIVVLSTHGHWDHIGGHHQFDEI